MKKHAIGSTEAEKWFAEKNRRRERRKEFWRSVGSGLEKTAEFVGAKMVPVIACLIGVGFVVAGLVGGALFLTMKDDIRKQADDQKARIAILERDREWNDARMSGHYQQLLELDARIHRLEPQPTNAVITNVESAWNGAVLYCTNWVSFPTSATNWIQWSYHSFDTK